MDSTRGMTTGRRRRGPGSRAAMVAVGVVVAFLATAAPLRPSPAKAETPPAAPEVGTPAPPDTMPPPEHPMPAAGAAPGDPSTVAPAPPSPPSPGPKAGEELVDRRTATSKTFATDKPGEFVTKLFASAVHYRDAGGRWADIDSNLGGSKDGRRRARANAFGVEVADSSTDAAVARLRFDADHSVGFALEGAAKARGRAEGDRMTYPRVRPDADMRLTSRPTGIKEEMVLASPAAPDRFVFPLELRGLTASIDAGGDVVYRDKAGKEWARTPHGYMFDSAVDLASGEPATSQGVTYALISRGRGVALEVRLDRAWLADPARQWPITVDPELHAATGGDDTYVMSGFNRDNSYDAELKVGTYDGGAHIGRSYMRFDTAALAGATVGRAELHLAERHSWNCGTWPEAAYRVTGDWNRGTQWPGAPVDPNWAGGVWAGGSCPNRLAVWNVTGMAAYWAVVRDPKGSISLRATNEGENNLYKKYSSIEGGNPPALHVWYSFSPVVPYAVTPAHGARVFTPSNPATAYYADGDGTPGKVLFAVYNYATQLVTAGWSGTVCSGCQGTWTIPALPDGWYQLYAIGHDGANYSPAWAGPQWFFVDTLPPAVPTNITPGPGAYVSSGASITASARYSEPYGWAGQVLFYVLNSTGGVTTYAWSPVTASGALATVTLPALPIDTYTMWTYAYDGKLSWTSHTFSVAAKPGAPTGVQAQPGALSALLSWLAPANGGSPITRINLTATDTAGGAPIQTSCTTECLSSASSLFSGLTAGHSYRFTTSATNAVGTGPMSAPSDPITALAASVLTPTNVVATRGDTQASVSWAAPTISVPLVTNYTATAYRAADDVVLATTSTVAATATVTGLKNGTPVYFKVLATTLILASPASVPSNVVTPAGPPFAPTEVAAERGNGSATVNWNPPAPRPDGTPGDNGDPISSYTVTAIRSSDSVVVMTQDTAGSPVTLGGLRNATPYFFTVHARNGVGPGQESAPTNTVVPAGPPFAPVDVTTVAGIGNASAAWSPPPVQADGTPGDNGDPITVYTVTAHPGGASKTVGANIFSATVEGLTPGDTYELSVSASNGVDQGPESMPSNPVTPIGPPVPPLIGPASAGDRQAAVSWTPPERLNGSALTGYIVTADPVTGPGSSASTTVNNSSQTSASVFGLIPGTTYRLTVVAMSSLGNSGPSGPSNPVVVKGPPAAPSDVRAVAGDGQATISWAAPNNNGSQLSGYIVTASPGGATATADAASTSATVVGLANGTLFSFTVMATSDLGDSPPSSSVSAWPLANPTGGARVDLAFFITPDGNPEPIPCMRFLSGSTGTHFCRRLAPGSYSISESDTATVQYVDRGEGSGGGNYLVWANLQVYEGCRHDDTAPTWHCTDVTLHYYRQHSNTDGEWDYYHSALANVANEAGCGLAIVYGDPVRFDEFCQTLD